MPQYCITIERGLALEAGPERARLVDLCNPGHAVFSCAVHTDVRSHVLERHDLAVSAKLEIVTAQGIFAFK